MHRLRAPRPGRALAAALVLAGLLPAPALGAPSAADQGIAAAERRIEGTVATPDDYVELASAFMRKSRESGDPGYYARANAAVERALALDPNHYGALRTAPWVLLGLHDFRGALAVAERARAVEPEDWWNYGTLADAHVELGDYARPGSGAGRRPRRCRPYRRGRAAVRAGRVHGQGRRGRGHDLRAPAGPLLRRPRPPPGGGAAPRAARGGRPGRHLHRRHPRLGLL